MVKTPAKITKERYLEATGRRKASVARVRLYPKHSGIMVNGVDYKVYFKLPKFRETVSAPLELVKTAEKIGAEVKVYGGGLTGQAEAVRHGLSRALVKFNETYRKKLRDAGYLTRDSRMVERKKYGLKKARRAPQWAKR
jgi:small subunit ribosomal protein S9